MRICRRLLYGGMPLPEGGRGREAAGAARRVHPMEAFMRKAMTVLSLCSLIGVLCWGCGGLLQQGKCILAITLNTDPAFAGAGTREAAVGGARKAIVPTAEWTPSMFTIIGEGPGGAHFEVESASKNAVEHVVPGEWQISAKGFSSGGKEVASGMSMCTLQAGRTTTVGLVLYPLAGMGDLEIAISTNFTPAAGSRLEGELVYCGLPGSLPPVERTARAIDVPAEQPTLSFSQIEAGHYALSLRLIDSDGVVSGGSADSVIIAAGFVTSGTCAIELGAPTAEIGATVFSNEPLPPPLLSVSHRFAASRCPVPLALSRAGIPGGEAIDSRWYLNGVPAGAGIAIGANSGILPDGILVFPQAASAPQVSLLRADLVEEAADSLRVGASSANLLAADATGDAEVGWKAGYDFEAALGDSVYDAGANGTGNGVPYMARAVAASPSGLVAVSGLDEEGAIHAFAAGYGTALQSAAPSGAAALPLETSWIRLWRDRIKINGTVKSADRLAVSPNGRFIAAASSLSSWIALWKLGEHGEYETYHTFQAGTQFSGFDNIKGLCFSPDSAILYAASNKDGSVYSFDMEPASLLPSGRCELLPRLATGESYGLQDIKSTITNTIIVSSSDKSRLCLIENGNMLAPPATWQGTSGGIEPYQPSALAIAPDGDAFYVLCGGNRVLRYDRGESAYALTSTLTLGSDAKDAKYLAAGAGWSGTRPMIAVAGGAAMAIYEPVPEPANTITHICNADIVDKTGIADPSGLCFARGAFFLAGENAACVSVFGGEP